jgi:hypothetical protein
MSERRKPHNGRDTNGQHHTRLEDVEDLRTDVDGEAYLRDDVRTGGAVIDTGPQAGQRAEHIQELVDENREIVEKTAEHNRAL